MKVIAAILLSCLAAAQAQECQCYSSRTSLPQGDASFSAQSTNQGQRKTRKTSSRKGSANRKLQQTCFAADEIPPSLGKGYSGKAGGKGDSGKGDSGKGDSGKGDTGKDGYRRKLNHYGKGYDSSGKGGKGSSCGKGYSANCEMDEYQNAPMANFDDCCCYEMCGGGGKAGNGKDGTGNGKDGGYGKGGKDGRKLRRLSYSSGKGDSGDYSSGKGDSGDYSSGKGDSSSGKGDYGRYSDADHDPSCQVVCDCEDELIRTANPVQPLPPPPAPTMIPTMRPPIRTIGFAPVAPPPTPFPVVPPTPFPTLPPVPAPTPRPTIVTPTEPNLVGPPTCDGGAFLETCVCGDKIDVNFVNCDPKPDDWVGIYKCLPDGFDAFRYHPSVWLWTCYDSECGAGEVINSATLTFDTNLPAYTQYGPHKYPLDPGCYIAVLNRNYGASPPPFDEVVRGEVFYIG